MWSKRFPFRLAVATLLLALAWTESPEVVRARYRMPDLVNVPVERLIKNLEALAERDPKDAGVRLNLARAHAMAYALKTDTTQIRKDKENEGAWFGFEAAHVPFSVKPSGDENALKIAKQHLAKAIERYDEVLKLTPDNLTAALGHAWCVDQSGQKQKAVEEYRMIIEAAWKKEKDLKHADLGWYSVTAEAAGYLIPLLDKEKDKNEIETLQDRIKRMGDLPRMVTPVLVPLVDGLAACDLEDRLAKVAFDADGSGLRKTWTWITKDAGWLVYDLYHTGKADSALQLFGNVTFWMFWENGYQALAALDDDGDGMLKGRELQGFAIWQDVNVNGISEPGELKPVAGWGIIAISCRYVRDTKHPDSIAYSPQGVYFCDGSNRPTYDLILHQR